MFENLVRARFVQNGQTIITDVGRRPIKIESVWVDNYRCQVFAKAMVNGRLSTIVVGYKDDVVEIVK